jgi:hypothetical protein
MAASAGTPGLRLSHDGTRGVMLAVREDKVAVVRSLASLPGRFTVTLWGGSDKPIPATIRGAEIKDMGNTLTLNVQEGSPGMPFITALVKEDVRELKLIDPTNGVRQLFAELSHLRNGRDGKLGTADDNIDFKVIIRGAEDMPYSILEPVLKTCAEAQVKNVNFNTCRGADEASG